MPQAQQLVISSEAPPEVHYAVVPTRAAQGYASLPAQVRPILRLCDGTRGLDAICDAIPGSSTPLIVKRLESLGLIAAVPATRPRRDTPSPVVRWYQGAPEAETPLEAAIVEAPAPVAAAAPVAEPAPVAVVAPVVETAPVAIAALVVAPAPIAVAPPAPVVAAVAAAAPQAAPIAVERHFSDEEEAFFATPLPEELPWDVDLAR